MEFGQLAQDAAMYVAMVIAVASAFVKFLEVVVKVTPLDADDVKLPLIKRVMGKVSKLADKLALNPNPEKRKPK